MCRLEEVARLVTRAQRGVALTGAGISEESGVPTFRGGGGIWQSYSPAIYANPLGLVSALLLRPGKIASFVGQIFSTILSAEPNPAHIVLAEMEETGLLSSVITQNVDNLHQAAGSKNVIELHGNLLRLRCMRCRRRQLMDMEELHRAVESLSYKRLPRLEILRLLSKFFPRCGCGGRCRLDVVLFGESLPPDEFSLACHEIENCDLLLLIGTSGIVYPAASLPYLAKAKGAKLVEINLQVSALSAISDHLLIGKAADLLPRIANLLGEARHSSGYA